MEDNSTIAYIAGLFDGEGSLQPLISATNRRNKVYFHGMVSFSITNSNKEVLEQISTSLGLTNKIYFLSETKKKNWSPCWTLKTGNPPKILEILSLIEPFVRIRKEQIKLGKEVCHYFIKRKGSQWNYEALDEFEKKFINPSKNLNLRRGKSRKYYWRDYIHPEEGINRNESKTRQGQRDNRQAYIN